MKRRVLVNIFMVFAIMFASIGSAFAQTTDNNLELPAVDSTPGLPNIIISELQNNGPGSGTTGQEFIELYNNSIEIVNLLDFKLIYVSSTGAESDLFTFNEPLMFLPETFLIGKLSDTANDYLDIIVADFVYSKGSSGMAATAGGLKLVDSSGNLLDELYWTSSASSDTPAINSLEGGKSAQRYFLDDVLVTDEQDDFTKEFIVDATTPADFLYQTTPAEPPAPSPVEPPDQPIEQPKTIDNPKIFLNELFIDPTSPQLDSQDEFVEIYNPNSQKLDISGYIITAGTTTTYKHTMPQGTFINPNAYLVIKSANSSLTLSNSGGRVTLADNLGRQIDSVSYLDAESGASWAKNGTTWAWTVQVTPGAQNVIEAPIVAVKSTSSSTTSTKKSTSTKNAKTNFTKAPPIKINEVFPDPSSPQKDSNDEFIELYNPHDVSINIADYTITSGATRIYRHTIKAPATIPPKGYYTVTSAETSLSLPNSGGKVTLINNFDTQIDSVGYPEAVPGSSWAMIDGKWQWTASPTKNADNKMSGLIDGLNGNKQDSITKVSSAVVAGTDDTPLTPAPQPLPGWLLAVLGVAAVCYAAYEYRFEARNYYYKYSRLRSAR